MADLRKLFAKDSNDKPADAQPDGSAKPDGVSPAPQVATATTLQPANPFAKATGAASNQQPVSGAGTPTTSGNAGSSSEPKSGLATLSTSSGAGDSSGPAEQVASPAVDSLESLDNSTDAGVAPRRDSVTYFADETPATKPTRTLPEGLSKDALGFIDTLNSVYEIIHDPDLLGGVIKNIMIELKNNAEYTKLMSPEDVRVMVRGMRESMGLARVKKQETKAKRGTSGKRGKAVDVDMLADLDSLGLSI